MAPPFCLLLRSSSNFTQRRSKMVLEDAPPDVQGLPKRSMMGIRNPTGSGVFRRYSRKPVRLVTEGEDCSTEFNTLLECSQTADRNSLDSYSLCAQYRVQLLECMRKESIVASQNGTIISCTVTTTKHFYQ